MTMPQVPPSEYYAGLARQAAQVESAQGQTVRQAEKQLANSLGVGTFGGLAPGAGYTLRFTVLSAFPPEPALIAQIDPTSVSDNLPVMIGEQTFTFSRAGLIALGRALERRSLP